jgi:hypothetical protein
MTHFVIMRQFDLAAGWYAHKTLQIERKDSTVGQNARKASNNRFKGRKAWSVSTRLVLEGQLKERSEGVKRSGKPRSE